MSPEVCQNQPYSYKSDVWALGCILYEMCALQQAWNGSNLLGLVYKIVQEKYPPLSDHYSDDLKQLVADMLSKDPALRPNLGQILRLPFVRARMQSFIDQVSAPQQQPSPQPSLPPPGQPTRPPSGTAAAAGPPAAPQQSRLPLRSASRGAPRATTPATPTAAAAAGRPPSSERGRSPSLLTPPGFCAGPSAAAPRAASACRYAAAPAADGLDSCRVAAPPPRASSATAGGTSRPRNQLAAARAAAAATPPGPAPRPTTSAASPAAVAKRPASSTNFSAASRLAAPTPPRAGGGGGGGCGACGACGCGAAVGGGGCGGGGETSSVSPPAGCAVAIPRSRSPTREQWRQAADPGPGPPSAHRRASAPESSAGVQGLGLGGGGGGGGGDGRGLTPKEQMRLRKQREADRRSVELTQAVAASAGNDVARRLTQAQFQSSLADDYTPTQRRLSSASVSSRSNSFAAGSTCSCSGYGSAEYDEPSERAPQPPIAAAAAAGQQAYGLNYGGNEEEYVRESLHATSRAGDMDDEIYRGPSREVGHLGRDAGTAGTVTTMMGTMSATGVYEADFEDYAPTERLSSGRLSGAETERNGLAGTQALQAARQQAAANAGAADAQRARLRDLARQHVAAPDRASYADEGGGQPVAVVPRETPLQALKQKCAEALGGDFPAVYSYLKTARQQNEADGVVRRNLLGLVGNARLGDCMWVDQLIFKEELASTPASARR